MSRWQKVFSVCYGHLILSVKLEKWVEIYDGPKTTKGGETDVLAITTVSLSVVERRWYKSADQSNNQ